jgi:acyl-CoA-dependent ceramide synthase
MAKGCYRGSAENLQGPFPVPDGWSHLLEPFRDPKGMICFDRSIVVSFLSYLLGLQAIIFLWSVFIFRVAVRVLQGHAAEDVRSDEEDENEEQEERFEHEVVQPFEEEVGVEGIDFKGWERRTGVKRATGSSGISLPGHSDQKQLLNRIGCEKQID